MTALTFTTGHDDEDLREQFTAVATRSYGHPVADIDHLRDHADLRVAVRDGRVVAGGLGLLVDQFFGGNPVPSACLAAGCVAPEERGDQLAAHMVAERLAPLREQGAVISTVSTVANGYARRLGWQAPTPVVAWSVTTDDLRRSFPDHHDLDIDHGLTAEARDLQRDLARHHNAPVDRPDWWWDWKTRKSTLETYRFTPPGGTTCGVLTLATSRRDRHGMTLTVHDFWAADHDTTHAMLAFLGGHNTRAATIDFRRGALPPHPTLVHNLHRCRMTATAWHPWMLRILDTAAALRRRGWPADLDTSTTIEVTATADHPAQRYHLRLADGRAEVEPTTAPAEVTFTPHQLAVWYAGGYRTTTAADIAGVRADKPTALSTVIRATTAQEPWLPDHF
ncbi:GNAT family N-acetyltransferase [Saccharothrix sp.]|uniref:GNAT family N-acetyltransferase n=1 Tax=Saccharothrix sp. TaxID=1873460 RepID=UPI002810B8D0|nr:GNAT family N-acetyltransferase [Saccharothrix sp.]